MVVEVKAASINPVDYEILEGKGTYLFGGRKYPR
jgi:NADPH:quinone reductase-like Zn-dependent oxidoreductase